MPVCSCNSSRMKQKHGTFLLCATEELPPSVGGVWIHAALHAAHPCQKTFPALEGQEQQFTHCSLIPPPPLQRDKGSRLRTNFLRRHHWNFGTAKTLMGSSWVWISTGFTLGPENTDSKTIFCVAEAWGMNWCRVFNCAGPAAEHSAFPLMKIWHCIMQQQRHVLKSLMSRSQQGVLLVARVSSSFVAIKACFGSMLSLSLN